VDLSGVDRKLVLQFAWSAEEICDKLYGA